jgi:membrane protein DedA with SNARE-associated domain
MDVLGRLAEIVTSLVTTAGYPGLALLTALENLFPPIPSELILPLAGFLVAQGLMEMHWLVLSSTIGSVAGALILYAAGARVGADRVHRFVERYGRYALLDLEDLERAESWFDRHGRLAVIFGHLVPGVRSIVSVPAGIRRMPLGWFVLSTVIGAGTWNAVLATAGALLGSQWERVGGYAEMFGYVALALVVVAVVVVVWRRR